GDPLTQSWSGIGTLQGDAGWRRTSDDGIALRDSRGVGRRVAEVALTLKRGRLQEGSGHPR
ncbi:hypothetical protein J7L60_04270, partial [Candidatus Bathyarchaeota archaeon]|nr:hypothetical protein [Candidatus Bathyarchaeota archaeon]